MGCNCKHAGFCLDSGVMTTDSPRLLFPFLIVFLEVNELCNKTSTTCFSQPPRNPQWPLWSSWLTYYWDVCHFSSIQFCIYSEFELFVGWVVEGGGGGGGGYSLLKTKQCFV